MVAIVQLEQCVAGACIPSIIINKLDHLQEPCLIILFKVNKGSKVGFYGAVLPFRLTVYLRIEGSGEPLLDAKKVAKQ